MNPDLAKFATAFAAKANNEQFLALSEGLVKVRCMEAALSLGWVLQEGAGNDPNGSIADFVVLNNGQPAWQRMPRLLQLKEGSADLAIVAPIQLLLEIKARPDYGTKSQAQFQQMEEDVTRVARFSECAFLFVFDPKIYLSFSNEKTDTRGRKAVAADWFRKHFPPRDTITLANEVLVTAVRDGTSLTMLFRPLPHHSQERAVLVVGCQSSATFGRPAA